MAVSSRAAGALVVALSCVVVGAEHMHHPAQRQELAVLVPLLISVGRGVERHALVVRRLERRRVNRVVYALDILDVAGFLPRDGVTKTKGDAVVASLPLDLE